jgi:hypothetical protein
MERQAHQEQRRESLRREIELQVQKVAILKALEKLGKDPAKKEEVLQRIKDVKNLFIENGSRLKNMPG